MEITEEKRAELIKRHKDSVEEMRSDVDKMEKSLGADSSIIMKLRSVWNIMSSMTDEEIILWDIELNKVIADELNT